MDTKRKKGIEYLFKGKRERHETVLYFDYLRSISANCNSAICFSFPFVPFSFWYIIIVVVVINQSCFDCNQNNDVSWVTINSY